MDLKRRTLLSCTLPHGVLKHFVEIEILGHCDLNRLLVYVESINVICSRKHQPLPARLLFVSKTPIGHERNRDIARIGRFHGIMRSPRENGADYASSRARFGG